MSEINMKKIDGTYQVESYDPFSEYVHHEQPAEVSEQAMQQTSPLRPKEELLKNIDDMFDGADFVFAIANKFIQRLGGK